MWFVSHVSTATATDRAFHRHIPISNPTITPRKSLSNLVVSFSADPQNDIGGLGRTFLTAIPQTQLQKSKPQEDGSHISGSDVLWAMKKVADKKMKKKKKQSRERVLSSVGGLREDSGGTDYERHDHDHVVVRPLVVKSEWASQLDDLEKRLIHLSQTK